MPVLTEPPSMGDVLKYEVNPNYTREVITLLIGTNYPSGAVLGRITASGKYTLSAATGADGAQVAVAVLLYPVNATLADAVGIVVARGPSIVSRAGLPDNISRGARGGPERRTQVVELASGDEERNASWANSRRRYDVAYGIRRADDLASVVAFF